MSEEQIKMRPGRLTVGWRVLQEIAPLSLGYIRLASAEMRLAEKVVPALAMYISLAGVGLLIIAISAIAAIEIALVRHGFETLAAFAITAVPALVLTSVSVLMLLRSYRKVTFVETRRRLQVLRELIDG